MSTIQNPIEPKNRFDETPDSDSNIFCKNCFIVLFDLEYVSPIIADYVINIQWICNNIVICFNNCNGVVD